MSSERALHFRARLDARSELAELQRRLRIVLPSRRVDAKAPIALRGLVADDLQNELLELPAWFNIAYRVARVLPRASELKIVTTSAGVLSVFDAKARDGIRSLRVRPSRYRQRPLGVRLYAKSTAVGAKEATRLLVPPRAPPSIGSESGFSTRTASTATTVSARKLSANYSTIKRFSFSTDARLLARQMDAAADARGLRASPYRHNVSKSASNTRKRRSGIQQARSRRDKRASGRVSRVRLSLNGAPLLLIADVFF